LLGPAGIEERLEDDLGGQGVAQALSAGAADLSGVKYLIGLEAA
jgi:hypothetical protein